MSAVTLALINEQDYLGFDYVDAQIEDAQVGDVVSLSYDFGAGPKKIVGTFGGTETRESGERFVWVTEQDAERTRYAIPEGMVEALRIEAKASSLPLTSAGAGASRKRHNLTESHDHRSTYGRVCARLDYEGMIA